MNSPQQRRMWIARQDLCVEINAFAHVGTAGGGGPGGALSQSLICSLGSVLFLIHCIQRDATTALQLSHQSCHHLEMNSTPHVCIKGDTGMTTAFSFYAKISHFLTWTPEIQYILEILLLLQIYGIHFWDIIQCQQVLSKGLLKLTLCNIIK